MINVYTHPKHERTCALTLEKLNARHIEHRIISRANEPHIDQWLSNHGHLKSPVVEVTGANNRRWSGYRPDLIDALAIEQAHHEQ